MQAPGARQVAVEFNTLSKSHNMAGWRVGALVGNPDVLKTLFTLKTNVDSSHFLPVLEAAVVAMTSNQAWLEERNETYRQRRDAVVAALGRMGLCAETPLGSLYVWCQAPRGWTSNQFVSAVLENAHVSFTPGTLFGKNGQGFVRIAITAPLKRTEQAMDRLAGFLSRM
jgi:LL-diaminopimelate aminotransferase